MKRLHSLGLGDYLHEIDPLHRDSRVLSANQVVFCQIHFDRGINDCLKKEASIPTGAASIMRSILETSTSEEYREALDWIIERETQLTAYQVPIECLLSEPFRFRLL